MTVESNDKRLVFVPVDEAIQPKLGICMCYKDKWWIVDDKGLLFWQDKKGGSRYPQCNSNKFVADTIHQKMYPWARVEFIPWVYEKVDPRDYV